MSTFKKTNVSLRDLRGAIMRGAIMRGAVMRGAVLRLAALLLVAPLLAALLAGCVQTEPPEVEGPLLQPASIGPFVGRVVASRDDVEERDTGYVKANSATLQLVDDGFNQIVGLRFAAVDVPVGADVTAAWIQFTARKKTSGTVNLTIQAVASTDAPAFGTAFFSVSSLPRGQASVAWSPPAWTTNGAAGPAQRTPDLSALVSELVTGGGWTAVNAMSFIVTGTGQRVASAYDDNPGKAAELHIEYSQCPSPPCNLPPTVDAGSDVVADFPDPVILSATVTDEGAPTVVWETVSGPGSLTFVPVDDAMTSVTAPATGNYVARITVDDGEFQADDEVSIAWIEEGASNPVVSVSQVHSAETGFTTSGSMLPVPAVDPAGVTALPGGGLLISDSEIEEPNLAAVWSVVGANLFSTSLTADTLYDSWDLTTSAMGANVEPTGLAYCEHDGHLYVTNDQWPRSVYRYQWSGGGPVLDGTFVINAYVSDPEGIACDPVTGRLYVISGAGHKILVLDYDGGFEFVALLDLFATAGDPAGVPSDGEGITFDAGSGRLFIVSRADKVIYEFEPDGTWVQSFDIDGFTSPTIKKPSGIAIGPSSADPSRQSFYVTDRRVDNDSNPNERDGALYEALIQRSF